MELVAFFVAALCVIGICYLIGRNFSMNMGSRDSGGTGDNVPASRGAEPLPDENSMEDAPAHIEAEEETAGVEDSKEEAPADAEAEDEAMNTESSNTEQEA